MEAIGRACQCLVAGPLTVARTCRKVVQAALVAVPWKGALTLGKPVGSA